MRRFPIASFATALGGLLLFSCGPKPAVPDINVGLLAELTGDLTAVGQSCKNAAELAAHDVNQAGGIHFGKETHGIRLIIEDTGGQAAKAGDAARRLIEEEKVVAIVGPNASTGAVPAGQVAESGKVLLISPWATAPKLTLDEATGQAKKYVFRACFTDAFQGRFLAKFAVDYLHATKAAVLFDEGSEAPKSQAEVFKKEFEAQGGQVVAFEGYPDGAKDFSAQIAKIKEAKPDVVLLPNYYNAVPAQIQAAKAAGIKGPFVGTDNWNAAELVKTNAKDLEGTSFCAHYWPGAKVVATAVFAEAYKKKYGATPDDVAALTYDAVTLLARAIEAAGSLDRGAIRDGMAKITVFEGVTGKMTFRSPDPIKSAVMLKVTDGKPQFITSIDP
jgi:branched-chain amino acid transport system substrate-binding protein